ncbi:hypothetical protein ONZ60_22820 (plasmid) [Aeromonas salmonicida]|uniref:hypothetical protein n=1 Tax=Aeromonas salmonicida TaxID=645 RepID=UPI00031991C9|nr:hypothetical protein [Aeromonas salmonicida]MCK3680619.1 hypothetical protein [Aeromonas salmonicida subsp. salmonicida]UDQ60437.1 hypothetical protein LJF99_22975 [Aeromonas salmonicida subsp. salmonicida]UYZ32320.1 hypothetical protein AXW80_23150 [Aeromonas salmonicida subsp. salmonicida]UYZ32330.1 hypothetical protein AXW80_22270 [Aeromonas salmonicida subsp. salmonicida]WCB52581.1 hypothetical protein PI860_22575 [Aeromonas salmonicida subsp. salmonicida]
MALPAIGGHIHLNRPASPQQTEGSPLLAKGNKLFEQSVQRGIGHFQSSDLKQVISALRQLQSAPDSGKAPPIAAKRSGCRMRSSTGSCTTPKR